MPDRGSPNPQRPLRVALVTSSYDYIKDGVALTANRLVAYLERQGVEVLVFAPTAPVPALVHEGTLVPVPSVPLPFRPEYRLALGLPRAARRRIDAFRPDILHITVPDLLGYQALRFGQRRGTPVVASFHTRYDTYLRHYGLGFLRRAGGRYLRFFYNACREVYAPSASMIEALKAEGIGRELRLWSRGVDPVRFHPAHRSPDWRRRHGIGPDEVAVLFVSRLVREKALGTLAGTLAALTRRGVAHRAVFVGDGPDRAWLAAQVPDAVFTGFLGGDDLAEAYASADVFLFPSETETFGNVTLEAMASGLPAVCADATGSRSLVVPGETGFLAPGGAEESFANQVQALVEDAALRRRMGAAARQRALGFSWDVAMGALLGYYRRLAHRDDGADRGDPA